MNNSDSDFGDANFSANVSYDIQGDLQTDPVSDIPSADNNGDDYDYGNSGLNNDNQTPALVASGEGDTIPASAPSVDVEQVIGDPVSNYPYSYLDPLTSARNANSDLAAQNPHLQPATTNTDVVGASPVLGQVPGGNN
jgi:hypothetical protein